jgi:hypothetical protein
MKNTYKCMQENLMGRDHSGDLGINGNIWKWIIRKEGVRM